MRIKRSSSFCFPVTFLFLPCRIFIFHYIKLRYFRIIYISRFFKQFLDFAAFNFKVQLKYHILMHFNFVVSPRYFNLQPFNLAIVLQSDVYEFPAFYKYRGNHEIWTQDLNTSLFVFIYFLCVCVCVRACACTCVFTSVDREGLIFWSWNQLECWNAQRYCAENVSFLCQVLSLLLMNLCNQPLYLAYKLKLSRSTTSQRALHIESTSIRPGYYLDTSKTEFRRISTSFPRTFSM